MIFKVLLLLINLSGHMLNRSIILDAQVSSDIANKHQKVPGVRALIEFFYKYEELARFVYFHLIFSSVVN